MAYDIVFIGHFNVMAYNPQLSSVVFQIVIDDQNITSVCCKSFVSSWRNGLAFEDNTRERTSDDVFVAVTSLLILVPVPDLLVSIRDISDRFYSDSNLCHIHIG